MTGFLQIPLALALCILSLMGHSVGAESMFTDSLPDCEEWAERGDCDPNGRHPEFMRKNCVMSCFKKDRPQRNPETRKGVDLEEFYELSANTANGKHVLMEQFDVYRTVIYNVARMCDGSTKAFYESLEKSHALLPYELEIIAFPFDHPDGDFPKCRETNKAIEKRADQKLKIHVMEPIKINGPDTHPIFKYLKGRFDMDEIDQDFTHNFKINPDENSIEMKDHANFYALMSYISKPLGEGVGSLGNEF